MGNFKKLAQKRLFLPVFSMILVMLINVVYDIATGSAPLSFFMISIKNGVLYGRLIDILNRGSEIAILAIGMTLVVSASGGTDISVGSVMSLYAGVCCMILAGYGNVNVQEYAHPLLVGIGAGLLVTLICGVFNGFLVAYMNIQPMVATLILWSAGRAVGLLLCNSQIVYVRVPSSRSLALTAESFQHRSLWQLCVWQLLLLYFATQHLELTSRVLVLIKKLPVSQALIPQRSSLCAMQSAVFVQVLQVWLQPPESIQQIPIISV